MDRTDERDKPDRHEPAVLYQSAGTCLTCVTYEPEDPMIDSECYACGTIRPMPLRIWNKFPVFDLTTQQMVQDGGPETVLRDWTPRPPSERLREYAREQRLSNAAKKAWATRRRRAAEKAA